MGTQLGLAWTSLLLLSLWAGPNRNYVWQLAVEVTQNAGILCFMWPGLLPR